MHPLPQAKPSGPGSANHAIHRLVPAAEPRIAAFEQTLFSLHS
jgi:hypothetical protein